MINYNTFGNSLKIGLLNFSKKVSKTFGKPLRKFIADMIYGIIAAKSSVLTEIGRELKEPIALKKTEERLARNLSDFSTDEMRTLTQNFLDAMMPSIGPDTMLLIDGGDVTKPCSPKMEAIGSVRDGSTGEFADGYWTMGAVALSDKNQHPVPVYESLYPCKKQGGLGSSAETLTCLKALRANFDSSIPRVIDRGFDSGKIITDLTGNNEKFILRVNQNRVAVHKGKRSYIDDIVRGVVCESELVFHSKTGNVSKCTIGMTQVTLHNLDNLKLNLVVCKEFGDKPLVLYTNLPETLESIALRVVKAYLMRWRIEEFYEFKKQGLGLEKFRVRNLNSIKTLDLLVTIAAGFICALSNNVDSKTVTELIAVSKRIPKIAVFLKETKFFCYAVLDGFTCVLAKLRCGISHYFTPKPKDNQLCLPGFEKMG